jgi:nitrate reductase beta subunit
MKVMAQMGMVMNLDKCIGCHTCSVTCKQAWTNRTGMEYAWFNNVETRPGQGYPRRYEDQEKAKSGWIRTKSGRLRLKVEAKLAASCPSSLTLRCSTSRTITSLGPTNTTT